MRPLLNSWSTTISEDEKRGEQHESSVMQLDSKCHNRAKGWIMHVCGRVSVGKSDWSKCLPRFDGMKSSKVLVGICWAGLKEVLASVLHILLLLETHKQVQIWQQNDIKYDGTTRSLCGLFSSQFTKFFTNCIVIKSI